MSWQIWVGPAIGLAGLILGTYTYIMNRKPKRLQYEIQTDQEIITRSRYTRWADLSVRFGNRQLTHPRVVGVRVINTGKVEARANDFDEPLAVAVSSKAEIVAATITLRQKATGESQEIEPLKVETQKVVAPKTLINQGDWLDFRLLVDGDKNPPQIRGRIAGFNFTPYVPHKRMSSFLSNRLAVIAASVTALGLVTTILLFVFVFSPSPVQPEMVPLAKLATGDCMQTPQAYAQNTASIKRYWSSGDIPWGTQVPIVPCDSAHGGEVFFAGAIWPTSQANYPGQSTVQQKYSDQCNSQFETYIGVPVANSALTYNGSYPSDASWKEGDRRIFCVAFDPTGKELQKSIKRSGQ